MTALQVADITSYLEEAGWSRVARTPRGAVIWGDAEERRLLVPPRDGMGDGDLRAREIVEVLSTVEGRPSQDIIRDIGAPTTDVQSYRVFPDGLPSGYVPLAYGAEIVQALSSMFADSARTVLEGRSAAAPEEPMAVVDRLLRRIRLGPPEAGSYVLTVHLPADDPLARQTGLSLADGIHAAHRELDTGSDASPPMLVGPSANLCTALSELAGPGAGQRFEVGFDWARGVPAPVPAGTVIFPEGSGEQLRGVAARIRQREALGGAVLTGRIVDLHDDEDDRWRVQVRGVLEDARAGGTRRVVWVRFTDEPTYQRALEAHGAKRTVRARGVLARAGRRTELATSPEGFEVLG